MLKDECQVNNIKLCTECISCRVKKGKVHCRNEYFGSTEPIKAIVFVPQDFDCYQFEEA